MILVMADATFTSWLYSGGGLTTMIATAGTALAFISKQVIELWKASNKRKEREQKTELTSKGMLAQAECWRMLTVLRQSTKCSRVLLLFSSNSGGVPGPGCEIYTTALYESVDDLLTPMVGTWHRRLVDRQYALLLEEIVLKGKCEIITETMEHGELHDVYKSQGVVHSSVRHVLTSATKVWYLSVNYHKEAFKDPDTGEYLPHEDQIDLIESERWRIDATRSKLAEAISTHLDAQDESD